MKKATVFIVVLVMSMVWMISCGKSNVQTEIETVTELMDETTTEKVTEKNTEEKIFCENAKELLGIGG